MAFTANRLATAALVCGLLIASSPLAAGQQSPAPARQPQKQIQTLAVVNGQEITRRQVADECMRRFGVDVLESIVNKMLVNDECQRAGIVITEQNVNDEIVNKAKAFGMSGERYITLICGQRNITEDRLKNEIIWNELALRTLAQSHIAVAPDELAERVEFEFGEKIQVREIACNSMQSAQQIAATLATDPNAFEELAKKHSVDPNSAAMGGLLPPIRRNSGLPEFEQIAFSLEPGQLSKIFQVEDKFLLLKCVRIFPATELSDEQLTAVHERLIDELSNEKLRDAAADLFVNMQNNAQIINVMNDPERARQMPGVAAVVNNTKVLKNQVAEECIARFGQKMLETIINNTLLTQSLDRLGVEVAQEDINAEIQRAAESLGHLGPDGKVNIDQWLQLVTAGDPEKVDFYIEDEVWPTVALRKLVEAEVEVTNEDMEKGFVANYGPRVEALVIVSTDHRQALKVWNMATANPTQEYFGQLANQYSVEPASKNNFGQVPPIQKFGGRPELEKEAFSLNPGDISKVVQVGEYWITMFCRGQTTPRVTEFDAVRDELHKNILQKKLVIKMSETFNEVRTESQIDNYLTGTSQPGRDFIKQANAADRKKNR